MERAAQRPDNAEKRPSRWSGEVVAPGARHVRDTSAALLIELVAEASGLPAALLLHGSRCRAEVAEARQLAMYLMHVILQRPYNEVARTFSRDRTTVAHACARVEDRRDAKCFDDLVDGLEERLMARLAQKEWRRAVR